MQLPAKVQNNIKVEAQEVPILHMARKCHAIKSPLVSISLRQKKTPFAEKGHE